MLPLAGIRGSATLLRVIALALGVSTVLSSRYGPAGSGRGLVVLIALVVATASGVAWLFTADGEPRLHRPLTPDLWLMAAAGGVLLGTTPNSAAAIFTVAPVISAAMRIEFNRSVWIGLTAGASTVIASAVYHQGAVGAIAYCLGYAAAALGGASRRQSLIQAQQAEQLLVQTQRSHEEQLRAARLEESTRIAREIHDVLAHALAGLTIQLEATAALVEQGADRQTILARVRHAHELARAGLRETRTAVGALRGERVPASERIDALVRDFRATGGELELVIDPLAGLPAGPAEDAAVRVVQEALTNVRKHAPGAPAQLSVRRDGEEMVITVANAAPIAVTGGALAGTGGGYGIAGMRERAELVGASLEAGPTPDGWRVQLRLPTPREGERR